MRARVAQRPGQSFFFYTRPYRPHRLFRRALFIGRTMRARSWRRAPVAIMSRAKSLRERARRAVISLSVCVSSAFSPRNGDASEDRFSSCSEIRRLWPDTAVRDESMRPNTRNHPAASCATFQEAAASGATRFKNEIKRKGRLIKWQRTMAA